MAVQNIDFVVTWVNGDDKLWLEEKNKFVSEETAGDNRIIRYRYWGLLQYWFRGIEKFAPWVHKVHFVTCGHLPDWLNTEHKKLNIVTHSAFIPKRYLPTFNSNSIELFMHKIPGLSEQFVYFNDDVFLINKINPEDFFKYDMPRDLAVLGVVSPYDNPASNIRFNDIKIINRYFQKRDLTIRQWQKILCPSYGKLLIRSLLLYPFGRHTGFYDPHLALSFTKSTFETVWSHVPDELSESCMHKIRSPYDLSIWLMRYWNLAKGSFIPHGMLGKFYTIGNPDLISYIRKQKGKIVCCNDSKEDVVFEQEKRNLIAAFESILPEKSQFEK